MDYICVLFAILGQTCMNKGFRNSIYFFISLALTSCAATKFVPEGSYLLDEVKVVSNNKEVKPSAVRGYVRQNPNAKWFSLIKIPLYTYNLSGRDSTKWYNKFLRRIGDEPVIYDESAAVRSQEEITKALNNMGYMGASVKTEKKVKKKKMKLTYRFTTGKPYVVNSIRYDISDRNIERYWKKDSANIKLKPGMLFDVNVLDAERDRITNHLLQNGYYKFNKDFITYTADTVRNTYAVDLTMHLLPYKINPEDAPREHYQYKINNISYITDYDGMNSNSLSGGVDINDSIHYDNYPIYFKDKLFLRPKVLLSNTHFSKEQLYNEWDVQNTYNSFGRLKALKYTNVRFVEKQVGDSAKLDAYVMLTKGKFKSFSAELEGTNSAGDLGAAASVSFQHRNLFKGSETFTIKLRGAYEAITSSDYGNGNYKEYGVESSINFPRFMFPFLSSDFRKRVRATSEVGVQYNSQIRPEFSRTIASASWSYKWSRKQRTQHRVDLLDINYIYMPWISPKFQEEYLDKEGSQNFILKENYKNLMIVKTGYTFNFNSAGGGYINNATSSNSYSIRASIESAGNLLYGISKLIHQQTTDGAYSILNIAYAQYVKGDFDFAKNIAIDKRNSFAFHVGLGLAYPYGNSIVLPFEKRYFAGGANSVRGWSVRTLGPGSFKGNDESIDFMNKTGDIKLDLNMEYRTHLFWKINGAAFIDAGNIWTIRDYKDQPGGQFRLNTFYKQIAVAYGLGIRFDFDFFVIRFDGGMKAINPEYESGKERYPIINPKFSRDFAFHFAVGYPF